MASLSLCSASCEEGRRPATRGGASPAPRSQPASRRDAAPTVVVVVLDQIGAWVLERDTPFLDAHGPLRHAMEHGRYVRRVRYGYATTYTAPGHAAIYSGASPARSGVRSNRVWNREVSKDLSVVDDRTHPLIGRASAFAGPSVMRAETVGDVLMRHTNGRAKVLSLSLKDRSAVIPGGQHPSLVLWYDRSLRSATTSTYYMATLPPWLDAFRREHDVTALLAEPWTPIDPERLRAALGDDAAAGEGDWLGFGNAFPHDLRRTTDPYEAFTATPMAGEWLLALASRAARELQVGADDVPDLVAISMSNTDYVGHTFGPDSWESVDNLIRTDRALARFLAERERVGPVTLVVTADHGVAPLPERTAALGASAMRLFPAQLVREAQAAAENAAGPGVWVEAFVQPFLYLSAAGQRDETRARVVPAIVARLRTLPGVAFAMDVRAVRAASDAKEPVLRSVVASVDESDDAAIYIAPSPYTVVDEDVPEGQGTSHGSPWSYDTDVPLLVSGPGVRAERVDAVLPHAELARTIARALGVPPPEAARD